MTDLTPEEAMEMEWVRYWRERAERAEAEYEELERAELARDAMWEKDRAALARVRAIIDHNGESRSGSALTSDIRAAIEGDNQ